MSIPLIFLPTENACRSYGVPRYPNKINGENAGFYSELKKDGTYDFINGLQFTGSNPQTKANSNSKLERNYLRESTWIMDYLRERTSSDFEQKGSEATSSNYETLGFAYGTNEIIVEVLTNKPYRVKNERGPDGNVRSVYVTDGNDTKPVPGPEDTVAVFRILPEGEDFLKFNHSHDWGTEGVGSMIKDMIGGAAEFGQKISRAANTIGRAGGELNPQQSFKADFASRYESAEKPTLKFDFVLFTKNNFIKDIFEPIMLLNYYAAPSRSNSVTDEVRSLLSAMAEADAEAAREDAGWRERLNIKRELKEKQEAIEEEDFDINQLNKQFPGFRLLVTEPPPFFRVWHSSGLFVYPRMSLNNISYTFNKPFYNKMSGEVDPEDDPNAGGDEIGFFGNLIKNIDFTDYAFPVSANVTLEFECIDPLFYDDFVSQFSRAEELVEVNNNNTQKINVVRPDGS